MLCRPICLVLWPNDEHQQHTRRYDDSLPCERPLACRLTTCFEGTVVEAVTVGSQQYPIRCHLDLKKYYERESKLKIHFKNSESVQGKEPNWSVFVKDWSFDGKWIGNRSDGWSSGLCHSYDPIVDSPTKASRLKPH